MLVVDRRVDKSQIDPEGLYAITFDDKDISFVSGTELLSQVEIVGEGKLTALAKGLMGSSLRERV